MLSAEKIDTIHSVLCFYDENRADSSAVKTELSPHAAAYAAPRYSDKQYAVTEAGVAVIPITGTLVHRGSQMDSMSGLTSYSGLEKMIGMAAADADVKGILFDMATPGGQADGVFDLGRMIRAIEKPTLAIANSEALSAGYALAAAADKVMVTSTGRLGSIGVRTRHLDQSQKNAKAGLVYTDVFAGAKKLNGNPNAPLAENVRAEMQAEIDGLHVQFSDYVAEMRGMSADAVRAQEAGVYTGQAAIDAGLADAMMSFNDSLGMFEMQVSGMSGFTNGGSRQIPKGVVTMSNKEAQAAATPSAEQIAAQAADARITGATEMQARIKAIQMCDEAKGREKLASHLAFNTGMNADEAKALLAVAPQEVAQAATVNALAAGMATVTNPNVGADAAPQTEPAQAAALWDRSNKKLHIVK